MNWVIEKLLKQLELRNLIKRSDSEIYSFGLECVLLKILHISSYALIGLCMGELVSLLVSAIALIPLRKKAGGYHAKTRTGCYIFSCGSVFLLCLINRITSISLLSILEIFAADILILLFAPVENENRTLESNEKLFFRKQARNLLIIVNGIIAIICMIDKCLFLACWLGNGIILAGMLLLLGVLREKSKNYRMK